MLKKEEVFGIASVGFWSFDIGKAQLSSMQPLA